MKTLSKTATVACLVLTLANHQTHACTSQIHGSPNICENGALYAEKLNIGDNGSIILKPGAIFQISNKAPEPENWILSQVDLPETLYIEEGTKVVVDPGGTIQVRLIGFAKNASITDEGRGITITKETLELLRLYHTPSAQIP
ncbi:MAG: hypothetical protein LBT03_01385 [Holosporales bacterium]|jgi:hypothetical protein|nr:hypothetical protein [Holosporales bacterium]